MLIKNKILKRQIKKKFDLESLLTMNAANKVKQNITITKTVAMTLVGANIFFN